MDFGASQLDPGRRPPWNAVLRDSAGQPVAGELVTLFGSLGEVTPASALSDANGRITASYHAGPNAGAAMITVLAGVAARSTFPGGCAQYVRSSSTQGILTAGAQIKFYIFQNRIKKCYSID